MGNSIFINAYGTIVDIPVKNMSSMLRKLTREDNCPLHSDDQEAISKGNAYDGNYRLSDYNRRALIQEAKRDSNLWQIIFFLDSVNARC
ncbi:MAG: hypothetical protein HAW61_02475 [Candidatus Portiera sp.]|nr:hypothetical protein [Portiera sp.]